MRLLLTLLLFSSTTFAFDGVVFSSSIPISKDSPSIDNLVSSATASSPLVFLVNPDFVLAQFSKAANAYSTQKSSSVIVNAAKAAKSATSRFIQSAIHVANAVRVTDGASFTGGSPIYVVYADNWSSLDKLASTILPSLGDKATVVVTSSEAITDTPVRVKRVSTNDQTVNGASQPFPLLMPLNGSGSTSPCLFYLEGINVISKVKDTYYTAYIRGNGSDSDTNKWEWDASFVQCSTNLATKENGNQQQTFIISITPGGPDGNGNTIQPVQVKLTTTADTLGYWQLTDAALLKDLSATYKTPQSGEVTVTATASAQLQQKSIDYIGMVSVFGYSWNCWDTQAIFFNAADGNSIGISLHGVQIQVYAVDKDNKPVTFFVSKVESCTGTFSASSWMGIITSIVLFGVFIFGFLMLNSVQTMDRFDDPKQRQILINVRE